LNPFTDEDLKRLTEWINGVPARALTLPNAELIKALLARLEAAEKVCSQIDKYTDTLDIYVPIRESYQEWEKAAGRA